MSSYKRAALVYTSGRSQVWQARDPRSGAPCALKSAPRVSGFGIVHEATVAEALRQRCGPETRGLLLPCDSFVDADRLVLVLPWAELGDAATVLSRSDLMLDVDDDSQFLWGITADLCAGLSAMHAAGEFAPSDVASDTVCHVHC